MGVADHAVVGVAETGNSAVLVTLAPGPRLLERRRVDLTPPGTPTHPYHHEGSWALGRYADSPWARPIALPDAIALVVRVQALAAAGARAALDALAQAVAAPIGRIAVRAWPELPDDIEACIRDPRAHTLADAVMYRRALASAAEARGWVVDAYDRDRVRAAAAEALGDAELEAALQAMGRAAGPPWRAEEKLGASAAIVSLAR